MSTVTSLTTINFLNTLNSAESRLKARLALCSMTDCSSNSTWPLN